MEPTAGLHKASVGRAERAAVPSLLDGLVSRIGAALGALALAVLLIGVLASPSQAATAYEHVGEYGEFGTGPAQFARDPGPGRIATHDQSGKVFVVDTGNHRIQVFEPVIPGDPGDVCGSACATFDFELGDSATTNTPIGVAIDQQTADVYVIAAGSTNEIVKFAPATPGVPADYAVDGSFTSPAQGTDPGEIGSFGEPGIVGTVHRGGIVIDPSSSDLLVADPARDLIQRFDSDGTYIGDFNGSGSHDGVFQDLFDLAVDSTGDILAVDHVSGEGIRVERFDSTGTWQATLPMPEDADEIEGLPIGATVGINLETDEVLVGFKPPGGALDNPGRIAQFEVDEDGDDELVRVLEVPGDGFAWFILGIGVRADEHEGRLYAISLDNAPHIGGDSDPRVQVFDDVGTLGDPPIPEMCEAGPVTDVMSTQAIFCGTVDHGGIEAEWRFEYRAVGGPTAWLPVPVPNGQLDGTEEVPVDVGATATGLEPNTNYEVRLWAENAVTDRVSDIEAFHTEAAPPGVSGLIAIPGATMVSIRAAVNPRNSDTFWRIEYRVAGTAQWIEGPGGGAGDGGTSEPVMDRLYDLSPSTQYEVRVVAENAAGSHMDGEVVETGIAPSDRAYELASPLPTGGVVIDAGSGLIRGREASEDGNRVLFSTFATPLPGMGDKLYQRYVAERMADGWSTRPVDEQPSNQTVTMSRDGSNVLLSDRRGRLIGDYHPDDQNEAADLYLRDANGDLIWISRDPRMPNGQPQLDGTDVGIPGAGPLPSMMSADGRTVVFTSRRNLLDDDPHDSSSSGRLYKWSDSELELIGIRPGAPDPPLPQDVPTGAGIGHGSWFPNAVSGDGSRVFWQSASLGNRSLFASIDGHGTVEIVTGQPTYAGASSDGSRVIYQLAGDLHAFDVDVALSGSGDPVTPITDGGQVLGVAGVADSGRHIYFVSNAVLSEAESGPGGTEPSEAGRNLYRAELVPGGMVNIRFVAGPLASGSPPGGGESDFVATWEYRWNFRQSYASPDGSLFAFTSWAELIPGQSTGGFRQLYVYDDEERTLVCASCPADGSVPTGAANQNDAGSAYFENPVSEIRWIAGDGTVFFHTQSKLLPQITNDVLDVYAYRDGELSLLSKGSGIQPSTFHDASADGSTVFFRTGDALVPTDNEPGTIKLYAARIGGGIESQQQLSPEHGVTCEGEDCRDEVRDAPTPTGASTEEFRGAGDQPALRQCAAYARQARMASQRAVRMLRQSRALRQVARRLAHRGANPRRIARVQRLTVRATRMARAHMVRARDARERVRACRSVAGEDQ